MFRQRKGWLGLAALFVVAAVLAITPNAPVGADVVSLNPVAGNQGFLVVAHGDVAMGGDESEGPVAMSGDLSFGQFQIIPAVPPGTPTIPPDAQAVALYVGGAVDFADSEGILQVNNSGYVKIGDLTGTDATSVDPNGATSNSRISAAGAGWEATPRIQLTTAQPDGTFGAPTPPLFDFDDLFATYRARSTDLAACDQTVALTDVNDNPLPPGPPAGGQAYLRLNPGVTNVLNVSAAELAGISSITFNTPTPTADTPLVVNVDTSGVGDSFTWTTPNLAGIGSAQAPFILWNFPTATRLEFPSGAGATIEGTLYAPGAFVDYQGNNNIEGNVISAGFNYRRTPIPNAPRELHNFQFATVVSCTSTTPTTTSTTSTSTSTTSTSTSTTSTSTSTTSTSTTSTSTSTTTTTTPPPPPPPTSTSTTSSTTTVPPPPPPPPPTSTTSTSVPGTNSTTTTEASAVTATTATSPAGASVSVDSGSDRRLAVTGSSSNRQLAAGMLILAVGCLVCAAATRRRH